MRDYDAFFSTDAIKIYAKVVSGDNPVVNYTVMGRLDQSELVHR
ncbi:MAG: hypothetical protein QXM06_05665 [Archaeoglobaceae archaeon]